ncbi:MAG: M20/M25/M40 family metallo-hydrolase [Gemmatimonadetes bacterium]|nr:M20/M25/M40 family metallo-hydrolase [Gemmatimonadota bacterium]
MHRPGSRTSRLALCATIAAALLVAPSGVALSAQRATTAADAGRWLSALADDSLQGRLTGSAGAQKAARMIAERMQRLRLEPLGDDGFLQRVPVFMAPPRQQGGAERPALGASFAALDTLPAEKRRSAANVVGLLRGSDPALRDEYVIVGAHYDHLGVNGARAVDGDSIFNGADDDASGVVAMLETARQLSEGRAPKRSVIFVAFIGEENGMTGTTWFIRNPPRPLTQVVADLQVEMIGRPDSVAGGPGKGWLTGFERSTMGELLSAAGVALIADPRPAQNFFMRSDNYPFALEGIPAHTISSFGGHTDYHGVNDEVDRMDLEHVAAVINAAAKAVRVLADGERVTWKEGGKPVRR